MSHIRSWIVLFLILFFFNSYAQNSSITFNRISTDDGLSTGSITAIAQDSMGFIWLGTPQGLNRFDGYELKKFYALPGTANSLPDDNITSLVFSSDSILWIGTNSKGLVSYNPITEKFTHHKELLYNSVEDSYPKITKLFNDAKGSIWLATDDGRILKVNYLINNSVVKLLSTQKIINYSKGQRSAEIINDFCFLSESSLLVATWYGLYLCKFDKKFRITKNEQLTNDPVIKVKIIGQRIYIIAGFNLRYKIYTSEFLPGKAKGDNLNFKPFYPDPQNKSLRPMDIIKLKGQVLFALDSFRLLGYTPDLKERIYEEDLVDRLGGGQALRINNLFKDKNKHLWVATNGIGVLTEQNNPVIFHTLKNIPGNSKSLAPTSLRQILEDPAYNGIWIGGYDGLSLFIPESNTIKKYPTELPVYSLALIPDQEKYFLIGSDRSGLYLGNKETDETKPLKLVLDNKLILDDGHIFSIFIDKKNNIWFGCDYGLMKFELPANPSQIPDEIKAELLPTTEADATLNRKVTQIYPVNDSLFYLAAENYGIIKYNIASNTFSSIEYDQAIPNSISSNTIKTIFRASDGTYWIGTNRGLNKWAADDFKNFNNNFERIYTSDGLPNNVIYGILEDNRGFLWLSTNLGLSRFDPSKFTFDNFSKSDGLANEEFNTNSFLKTSSGEMYFGGIHGLTYFDPQKISNKGSNLKVVFTGLSISYKQNTINKNISFVHDVELKNSENFFSISFSALDYYNTNRVEFSYQLVRDNATWIYLGQTNKVTFTNVSPGSYKLRVRAKNSFTAWSDNIAELSITVQPPIWQTWWMYSVYAVILLLTFYFVIRYEENRQKHKQAAEIEKLRAENLLETSRSKSDFFANISHELRTPLTLILGMLESIRPKIKNTYKDSELEEKIDIAYRSGKKQLNLVNQILSLTKIDAGEEKLNASVKNIVPFLRSICASFESLAGLNKLELSFTTDYEIIPVNFDADKIEKIINNLLSNAIKFTPADGKISISINSELKNSDFENSVNESRGKNRSVKIIVEDNGIGIPEEKLSHIFDRFFQADNTITRKYEGIGIGLSLTKELVELHNGNISAESKSGEGTKFIISLPIDFTYRLDEVKDPDYTLTEPIEASEKRNEIPDAAFEKGGRTSVLVIEDNPDLRFYIKETLKADYNIIEAPDGKKGVETAEREIPDLIITDVMMPNMDGYEMTKILRENYATSHIPIIMITARASEEDKLSGLEAGVDAYLTKPFSTKELVLRVQKLLELREKLYKKIGEGAFANPLELKINSVDQQFLNKLKETVTKNISNENFTVEELASTMALSIRQFQRKLKALIDVTPSDYVRKLRMNAARELLLNETGNVSQISMEVGYSNFAAFSKAFKDEFGVPPSQISNN